MDWNILFIMSNKHDQLYYYTLIEIKLKVVSELIIIKLATYCCCGQ